MAPLIVTLNSFKTPSCVWVTEKLHIGMSHERHKLSDLEAALSKLMNENRKESVPFREPDSLVACQSSGDARQWHRGRVELRLDRLTGPQYQVILLDQGIRVRAKPGQLRDLPRHFYPSVLSPQAKCITLEGIVPLNMEISSNYDHMENRCSEKWSPAAEEMVNDILKKSYCAHFIESTDYPCQGQTYFGDLLVILDKDKDPISLKEALCEKKFAVYSKEQFDKRLKIKSVEVDGTKICESPAFVESSTDTSSSCVSSPAESMISTASISHVPQKTLSVNSTISSEDEGKVQRPNLVNLLKQIGQTKSETNSSLSSGEENKTPKPKVMTLIGKLKPKSPSAAQFEEPISGEKSSVGSSKIVPIEIPMTGPPRHLGDQFVPAGRPITSSPRSSAKSSLPSRSTTRRGFESDSSEGSYKCLSSAKELLPRLAKKTSSQYQPKCVESSSSDQENYRRPNKKVQPQYKPDCVEQSSSDQENRIKPVFSSYPMQDRLLKPSLAPVVDDDTNVKDYLSRPVLLHGGFPPNPWMTYNDMKSQFSPQIEQFLIDKRWCYNIMTLEKFMWPAIQQRQNVVMISPPQSGKTASYVVPLIDFMIGLEDIPKGNGPLVLILCAGSKSASKIHYECVRLLTDIETSKPRVMYASGLAIDKNLLVRLVNGCEVLITTPPCLLRLIIEYRQSYAVDFKRLQHYVLDDASILMSKFPSQLKDIQSLLVAEQSSRNTNEKEPIQIIVSSEIWEPHYLSFTGHLKGDPLLCINDCFEACVYGKPEVSFHVTNSQNKPTKLIEILRGIIGGQKIVLFCNPSEVEQLQHILFNECMDVLIARPDASPRELEVILSQWNSGRIGQYYLLLCSDPEFERIKDATCVIHYSFPLNDRDCFKKRLSALLENIPNFFEKKLQTTPISIHLLLDESNQEQIPVLVELMKRISDKIDKCLLDVAETESKRKELNSRKNKLMCLNLKMFGQCCTRSCPNRHVFVPELDATDDLPSSGEITMEILKVHSASRFSARLVEHVSDDNVIQQWPSRLKYLELLRKMRAHFSKPESMRLVEEINLGDIFAVETFEKLYQRVQIIEILEKNKTGKPTLVCVQYLDDGMQANVKNYLLHPLPEDLKAIPPQVTTVFLCGLLPSDKDEDYDIDATKCVKRWIFGDGESDMEENRLFKGKIMLSMTGSLWVDPLKVMEFLPHSKTYVVRQNIKKGLLKQKHALENPSHLAQLYKLCGKQAPQPSLSEVEESKPVKKCDIKPSWAFLEKETLEDVEFICGENASFLFVRKTKFSKLLENMMNELERDAPTRREKDIMALSPGDVCLARYKDEPKWFRARILSKNNDESVTVFYVDFGDKENVSLQELNCIPDWAVAKLPFQAIECSLAGVCCDNSDLLYDLADGKHLLAQVCERREPAQYTGGAHYIVVLIDHSAHGPLLVNKEMLKFEGAKSVQDQLAYLDIEIDNNLFNRVENDTDDCQNSEDNNVFDDDLDLSDFGFKDEDLDEIDIDSEDSDIYHIGDFDAIGFKSFQKDFEKNVVESIVPLPTTTEETAINMLKSTQFPPTLPAASCQLDKRKGADNASEVKNAEKEEDSSDWEEETDLFGRLPLHQLVSARQPQTQWFEDLYSVWIKFVITGVVDNYFLLCTHNTIQFSTRVGGRIYHLDEKLRGTILSVSSSVKGFTVEVKMRKACSGLTWGRPFAANRKYPWLSRDLDKSVAEGTDSDSEDDLRTVNKEIRKIPLKKRRRPLPKDMKNKELRPEVPDTDSEKSEFEFVNEDAKFDEDTMF